MWPSSSTRRRRSAPKRRMSARPRPSAHTYLPAPTTRAHTRAQCGPCPSLAWNTTTALLPRGLCSARGAAHTRTSRHVCAPAGHGWQEDAIDNLFARFYRYAIDIDNGTNYTTGARQAADKHGPHGRLRRSDGDEHGAGLGLQFGRARRRAAEAARNGRPRWQRGAARDHAVLVRRAVHALPRARQALLLAAALPKLGALRPVALRVLGGTVSRQAERAARWHCARAMPGPGGGAASCSSCASCSHVEVAA